MQQSQHDIKWQKDCGNKRGVKPDDFLKLFFKSSDYKTQLVGLEPTSLDIDLGMAKNQHHIAIYFHLFHFSFIM